MQVRNHIQSLFTAGMTWDNAGLYGWHIDHIKAIATFDLTILSERRKAFHYTNLQPLWAEDNMLKSDSTSWVLVTDEFDEKYAGLQRLFSTPFANMTLPKIKQARISTVRACKDLK